MRKLNCWEYNQCGNERDGDPRKRGRCPTATAAALNGVHDGACGGRSCWVVERTLCGPKNGSFADKYPVCCECDFYRMVMQEEGMGFQLSAVLIDRLHASSKETGSGGGLDIAA